MKFKGLIIPLLVAGTLFGSAQAALYQWSKTAATNATADATINWAEGMSPSSVNDSARAMMARTAEYRDDISGLLATAGTSTAYTVTTNQVLPTTPNNGQLLAVTPHTTNGASATLAADGGTAFAIQTAPGTAVAAGVLVSGTPYTLKFNSSASAWILRNFYSNPFNVPLGAVLMYSGSTAPNSNFALANGQCISRTTYATYFALVSTTYGSCDGSTTFGVPDLSNRLVAGSQMSGTARITVAGGNFDGSVIGTAGGAQNHIVTTSEMPSHSHTASSSSVSATGTSGGASNGHTHLVSGTSATESNGHTHDGSGTTGSEDAAHAHGVSGTTGGESVTHHHTGTTDLGGGSHTHPEQGNGLSTINVTGGADGLVYRATTGTTGSTDINHVHTFTSGDASNGHTHAMSFTSGNENASHGHGYSFTTGTVSTTHTHGISITSAGVSADHTHSLSVTGTAAAQAISSTGGSTAMSLLPPVMVMPMIVRIF